MKAVNSAIPLGGSYIFDSFHPSLPKHMDFTLSPFDMYYVIDYLRCKSMAQLFMQAGKDYFVTGVRTSTTARAFADSLADLKVNAKIYCGHGVHLPEVQVSEIQFVTDTVFDAPEMYAMRDWVADPDKTVFIPESLGAGAEEFRAIGLKSTCHTLQGIFSSLSRISMPADKAYILAAAMDLGDVKLELQANEAELRYVTVAGCATAILNDSSILPPEVVRGLIDKIIELVPISEPSISGRLKL